MLLPKRTKFRKVHRGRLKGTSKANTIVFGDYGIQAQEPVWLTSRQIEATRRSITRYVRKTGKIWIRVFPDKPITKKPLEVRMGKGKGNVEYWVTLVQPGRVLYEMEGVSEQLAREAFELAAAKLPVATTFVKRSVM